MTTRARSLLTSSAVVAALAATALVAPNATAAPAAVTTTVTTAAPAVSAPTLASAYTKSAADARIVSKLTARATTAKFGTQFSGGCHDAYLEEGCMHRVDTDNAQR